MEKDPRFIAAKKLRVKGRNEAAVQMLSDLVLAATEGKSEEEQLEYALAPLYLEYGSALACASRSSAAAEDQEATESSPKKRKRPVDEDDDGSLAWQVLDQARCIFEAAVEDEARDESQRRADRSWLARCCVQLGDLNSDSLHWGDAIVEYTSCVEQFEELRSLALDDEKRFIAALVGAALAYVRSHDKGIDVVVGPNADILVAPIDECLDRAHGLVSAAEKRLDSLLTGQAARDRTTATPNDLKTDLCSLGIELQAAKDALHAKQEAAFIAAARAPAAAAAAAKEDTPTTTPRTPPCSPPQRDSS